MVLITKKTNAYSVKFFLISLFVLFLLSPDAILLANQLPTASPTSDPPTGQEPLSVQFQANADDPDGDRLTYLWDFGDPSSPDNTSTAENPTHIYQGTGLHKATVVVSDGTGDKTFSRAIRSGCSRSRFVHPLSWNSTSGQSMALKDIFIRPTRGTATTNF